MIPGEYLLGDGLIEGNKGRRICTVIVRNTGDRPIQVGSHFHFFEVNRALAFHREAAYGMHLDIPAGTAARFEPGDEKEIALTEFAGNRIVHGFNGLIGGALVDASSQAFEKARAQGFQFTSEEHS